MNLTKTFATVLAQKYLLIQSAITHRESAFRERIDFQNFEEIVKTRVDKLFHRRPEKFGCITQTIDIVSYNLMPNNFSILTKGHSANCTNELVRRIMSEYTVYFNKKYRKTGPVFSDDFYSCPIKNHKRLKEVARHIHLTHAHFKKWQFSSYQDFMMSPRSWIHPESIVDSFDSYKRYKSFSDNYEEMKEVSQELLAMIMQNKYKVKVTPSGLS